MTPTEEARVSECRLDDPQQLLREQQSLAGFIDVLIKLSPNRLRCVLNLHNPQVAALVVERLLMSPYRDQISQSQNEMVTVLGL